MHILIIIISIVIIIVFRCLQLGIAASGSRFKRSIISEIKSREVVYDLKIPLYFLLIIVFIKIIYHYFQHSVVFAFTVNAPKWLVYIKNAISSFIQNTNLSKWDETYVEYLIVIGTYFIIVITKAIKKNKIQFDNLHWHEYEEKLQSATNVKALNLSVIEDFFEPMGFRYFLEQITELKRRPPSEPLAIERVVIIPEGEKLHDSWIMNYNPVSNEMNKEYRMLHNFLELHKAHGINLYFATKTEVLNFATTQNKKINAKSYVIEKTPFPIYFILLITFILPLLYVISSFTKWMWNQLQRIDRVKTYANRKSANSPIRLKDLDLLKIDSVFYAPKADITGTILEFFEISDDKLKLLADQIIAEFSTTEREAKGLFP